MHYVHSLRSSHSQRHGLVSLLTCTLKRPDDLAFDQVRQLAMVRSCASCLLNIVTTTLDAASHDAPADGSINGSAAAAPGSPRASMSTSSTLPPATRRLLRLRPLVDDVASLIRPLVNDGVVLVNDVPADLPLVASDAKRLSQVFFNLIGNAARFTHVSHNMRWGSQR